MKKGELAYLNAIREGLGLPIIKPGKVKCLKCDREFESEDVKTNRLCGACKSENQYSYGVLDPNYDIDRVLEGKDIHGRKLPVKIPWDSQDNR